MAKYLPCLNPNCKSHGKPHPNCRCYSGGGEEFAEGGEVRPYCSEDRAHNEGCEYYAGGGEVPASDLPDAANEVPADDLPESIAAEVPADDLPDNIAKASSGDGGYVEQAKAALEGASQGVLGPLAPYLETKLGISSKEAIAKRAEDFPATHSASEATAFVGSMFTPVGLMGKGVAAVGKVAEAGAQAAKFSKIGTAVFKSALESMAFTGSDEMTKAFLGQKGSDPEHPVSAALLHVGAAGLMGGLTGGAFTYGEKMIGKAADSFAGSKMAQKLESYLIKIGQSENPLKELGIADHLSTKASAAAMAASGTAATAIAAATHPYALIPAYYVLQKKLAPIAEKIAEKAVSKANPYVTDAIIKTILTHETAGVANAVHYAIQAGKAAEKVMGGISQIMKAGSSQLAPPVSDDVKKLFKGYIEGGGTDKQLQNSIQEQQQSEEVNFAQGGEVKQKAAPVNNDHFSRIFPEQNTLLSTAKGRIYNYLNSIRPQANQPKKAFDDEPDNKEQHRQYNKAIDFAVNPMSILNHVNKGDLTPEHMKHFTSLYPEVHRYLGKEMTKQITEAQIKKQKPPYAKRQAMSLFLGVDLDSTLSPQAVQAIQALYANKKAPQQAQPAGKKQKKGSSAALTKTSSSYLTDEQAREKRMQNQK